MGASLVITRKYTFVLLLWDINQILCFIHVGHFLEEVKSKY